jgi:hypothetical protein
MKKVLILIFTIIAITVAAQSYDAEALMYSRNMLSGTARSIAQVVRLVR